jgi:TPR repeat protein
MKMINSKVILILIFSWLPADLGAAEFNALENARKLFHIGQAQKALEMCREAAGKGDIEAQLQLAEWLFAKRSKSKDNPFAKPEMPFQKPKMDIERADRHNERLARANSEGDQPKQGGDQPKQGGDQPKQGGDEKPKEGIGEAVGKTGQFSPGGT